MDHAHQAEATVPATKAKKAPAEVTMVEMEDGRKVGFAGKRNMLKEVLVDEETGGVEVRFDFRNGQSRTIDAGSLATPIMLRAVGHGLSQKIGDECAGEDDVDDMVVAVDEMVARLQKGEWRAPGKATGDSFSGSSDVIRALCEVTGKSKAEITAFLQSKLDADKAKGGTLTRAQLYASFRSPTSKTGPVIARLQAEKAAKAGKTVDAGDLLDELEAA